MWSIVALKIDKFANSFLMVSIDMCSEVFRKALNWKVKIPSAIASAFPKLFGLTILRPYLVCIGTSYSSFSLSPSRSIIELELFLCRLIAPKFYPWGDRFVSIEREFDPSFWSEGELLFTLCSPSEPSVGELLFILRYPSEQSVGELLLTLRSPS